MKTLKERLEEVTKEFENLSVEYTDKLVEKVKKLPEVVAVRISDDEDIFITVNEQHGLQYGGSWNPRNKIENGWI